MIIFYLILSLKIGSDISRNLSPMKTTCVKRHNVFSGKNKKKVQNVTQHAKRKIIV